MDPKGMKVFCPFCHTGLPSYFAYMDHLQSTPCGIQQQSFNQPAMLAANHVPLSSHFYRPPNPRNYYWPQQRYAWPRPSQPFPFNDRKTYPPIMMGNESKQANTMQERPGSDEAVILAAAAVVAREKDSSAVASKMKNQYSKEHTWSGGSAPRCSSYQATSKNTSEEVYQLQQSSEEILGLSCLTDKNHKEEDQVKTTAAWIEQVLVSGSDGEFVPINIEDIAQVVEVDEEGSTHRTFLKESSTDPILGEAAAQVLSGIDPRLQHPHSHSTVQKASEPLTFENLIGNLSQGTSSADGPHPITSVSDDTIGYSSGLVDNAGGTASTGGNEEPSTAAGGHLFDEQIMLPILKDCRELQSQDLCPHQSTVQLEHILFPEQARDQMSLLTLQAKLGYALIGILGEHYSKMYGYPHSCVIRVLHHVLDMAGVKVMEESYLCSNECKEVERILDQQATLQNQLSCRFVKLRLRVLRANIGKLLCVCVPEREKWLEFGWIGKSVDQVLEDLAKEEIPSNNSSRANLKQETKDQRESKAEIQQRPMSNMSAFGSQETKTKISPKASPASSGSQHSLGMLHISDD